MVKEIPTGLAVLLLYFEACDLRLCTPLTGKRSHKSFSLTNLQQASSLDLSDGDIICVLLSHTPLCLRLTCTCNSVSFSRLHFPVQIWNLQRRRSKRDDPLRWLCLATIIRQPPFSPHPFPGQATVCCVLNPGQRLSPVTA